MCRFVVFAGAVFAKAGHPCLSTGHGFSYMSSFFFVQGSESVEELFAKLEEYIGVCQRVSGGDEQSNVRQSPSIGVALPSFLEVKREREA